MLPLDPIDDSPVNPLLDRVVSVVIVLGAAAFVWILSTVQPDAKGRGTHVQLGLPPCGWVVEHQMPCPTCGVTTAAAHLVRLQPWRAVKTQPFGAALAGFGLWLAFVAAWCLAKKRSFVDYLLRMQPKRIVVWGLGLLLASWAYTIATFVP